MSQNLGLKLKQTQQLNQNLHQALRILQMSGLEIEREVDDWLQDNPLLERAESSEDESGDIELTRISPPSPKAGKSVATMPKTYGQPSPKKKISTPFSTNRCANTP